MSLSSGARLGPYEILSPLGSGGMGEVFLAKDTRLGREVAIKILPADVASDPDRLARFEREAKAVSALNHPHIVTLYEVGTSEAGPYLVLEKIDGRSLRELLNDGPMPVRRVLTLGAQIAEGIAKAHAAGIVHRDLKPENIMVTGDGHAKVLDFGLAKLVWPELGAAPIEETTLVKDTASGVILGTLGYLSPEQASGKPADYRADQFALGALLYEMATRERPFKRATVLESLTATIRDEPEPVRAKRADVPAPFEWLIERCLAKDPNDRYASTSDLARELASLRDHLSDLTRLAPGEAASRPARVLPRGLSGWAVALAVLAAVGAGGFFVARQTAAVSQTSYQPLTFQRGLITGARFARDGKTVYYSASYGTEPSRIFVTNIERIESKPLDVPPGFLLGVSTKDELVLLLTNQRATYATPGILARVPAVGGTPRNLVEDAKYADWAPDGERLAIVRGGNRCEFPVGRDLALAGPCTQPRVSPTSDRVALMHAGGLEIVDLDGKRLVRDEMPFVFGLAWTPDGKEVWFTGSESGGAHDRALYALSLSGVRRLIARAPGPISIYDVSPDGRSALVVTGAGWFGINASALDSTREQPLDLLGRSSIVGLSSNGKLLLIDEAREVGTGAYLRSTDGARTVPISKHFARGLSPDGALALVQPRGDRTRLTLVPTGAGAERDVPLAGLEASQIEPAQWSRDGRRLFMWLIPPGGKEPGARLHVRLGDGPWQAITPAGIAGPFAVSPDGQRVAVREASGTVSVFSIDAQPPQRLDGEHGRPILWSRDGRHLFLVAPELFPARVYRRDLVSGQVEPWRTIAPADPTGVLLIETVLIADDERSFVYQYSRGLNDLYLARGLR